jgi:ferrous iron transport protein B
LRRAEALPLKLAIVGRPNVGKSTIFNYLTGLNQKISNYPGVTVDKKTGVLQIQGENFEILDLTIGQQVLQLRV